jgi:hypothetical protein
MQVKSAATAGYHSANAAATYTEDQMAEATIGALANLATAPLLKQHETAIVDSGCTGHFLLVNAPCLNKVKSRTPLTVRLPNGATMDSSHTAELDIPELNAAESKAHIFPLMANHSLLSVGQLCDEGYIVTFKQASVKVCNSQKSQILSSPRDLDTGIWRISLRHYN